MKKINLSIILLIASMQLFSQYYLNGYEPEVIDAKGEGLGRTSILSTQNGANLVFNNPALLGGLLKKSISLNLKFKFGKTRINQKIDNNIEKKEYGYPLHVWINGFSFGIPVRIKKLPNLNFAFGIGYRMYFDHSYIERYESTIKDDSSPIETHSIGGYTNHFVLATAINYKNKLMFGVSASSGPWFDPKVERTYRDNGIKTTSKTDYTYRGSFLTFSGAYIHKEKISFGLRFRNPFTYEREYYSNSSREYIVDVIGIPAEIGIAIKLNVNEGLKVFAEYITRNFGSYKVGSRTYDSSDPTNNSNMYEADSSYSFDSKNGFSIRTGVEIEKNANFRLGTFFQSVPIYENMGETYGQNPKTEIGFTFGIGKEFFEKLDIDFYNSFSFLIYKEEFIDSSTNENVSNDYTYLRDDFGITIGFKF